MKAQTKNTNILPGPLVIGGVGGSGTRVVAEIIKKFGYYIGCDLNSACDNLWFTLLLKRPKWYKTVSKKSDKIFTGFQLLSKAMIYRSYPSLTEILFALRAIVDIAISGPNYEGYGKGCRWPLVRTYKMITNRPKILANHIGWGWKEPNSHIYIKQMAEYFQDFKYIHTIRHGLDMAFSKNQQQLFNWGPLFGVELPRISSDLPGASLKYWIKANQRVLRIANDIGNKKFLLINFDRLCITPKSEIQRIQTFLDISQDSDCLEQVFNLPKKPESFGRYRNEDLSQFDYIDLDAVKTFDYSIEV
jgi:hypothetical protein